jgi:carbon storage regulator CsrA
MLVLTRKKGQRIVIPELGVTIVVAGHLGDKIRIGVEAPKSARILREECLEKAPRAYR